LAALSMRSADVSLLVASYLAISNLLDEISARRAKRIPT
jgi:hypothetical protein